jgi:hypothetical protein
MAVRPSVRPRDSRLPPAPTAASIGDAEASAGRGEIVVAVRPRELAPPAC